MFLFSWILDHVHTNISEKHAVTIFRAKAFPTKLKWETIQLKFCITAVTTVSCYSVCVCVCTHVSSLREWRFQLNHTLQFNETDFMQLVLSVYDPPKCLSTCYL
jgi:hypothetical protein